ncbi:hypothetical protein H4R34_002148, partial [Dimargaris verticillata]
DLVINDDNQVVLSDEQNTLRARNAWAHQGYQQVVRLADQRSIMRLQTGLFNQEYQHTIARGIARVMREYNIAGVDIDATWVNSSPSGNRPKGTATLAHYFLAFLQTLSLAVTDPTSSSHMGAPAIVVTVGGKPWKLPLHIHDSVHDRFVDLQLRLRVIPLDRKSGSSISAVDQAGKPNRPEGLVRKLSRSLSRVSLKPGQSFSASARQVPEAYQAPAASTLLFDGGTPVPVPDVNLKESLDVADKWVKAGFAPQSLVAAFPQKSHTFTPMAVFAAPKVFPQPQPRKTKPFGHSYDHGD